METPNQLNPKQQRFCDEYLVDLNATQAARRAGYTESTADGGHLMNNPLIQAYLSEKQKKKNDELDVSHDRIMQELAKIAFSDAGSYFDADNNLKSWDQIPQKDRAAVVAIDVKRVYSDDGKKLMRESIKLRLHSKLKALDMLLYRLDLAEMLEAEAEENRPYDASYLDDNFGLPKVDMSGFEPSAAVMGDFDDDEVPEPVIPSFKPFIPMPEPEVLPADIVQEKIEIEEPKPFVPVDPEGWDHSLPKHHPIWIEYYKFIAKQHPDYNKPPQIPSREEREKLLRREARRARMYKNY